MARRHGDAARNAGGGVGEVVRFVANKAAAEQTDLTALVLLDAG